MMIALEIARVSTENAQIHVSILAELMLYVQELGILQFALVQKATRAIHLSAVNALPLVLQRHQCPNALAMSNVLIILHVLTLSVHRFVNLLIVVSMLDASVDNIEHSAHVCQAMKEMHTEDAIPVIIN